MTRGAPGYADLVGAECADAQLRTEIGENRNLVDRSNPMDSLFGRDKKKSVIYSVIYTVIYWVNYFSAEGDLLLELGFL